MVRLLSLTRGDIDWKRNSLDNEKVPGVHEEADTSNGEQLGLTPRDAKEGAGLLALNKGELAVTGVATPSIEISTESHFGNCLKGKGGKIRQR